MAPATPAFKHAVLAAMPAPPAWATAKQVYAKLDVGSYQAVRDALSELAAAGVIARFGPITEPAYRFIVPGYPPRGKLLAAMREHQTKLAEWKAK
jgi:hypothetical protein